MEEVRQGLWNEEHGVEEMGDEEMRWRALQVA